ncbi:hypothetical protein [uncultured Ferrimonas sp.]|uniref:hypothetical protein n=1 Tax=uncultured Ferrimonas sp. TaxID=432640 RepID=UPI0026213ADF|nr:hypothetical protein [uncultured Ferrimonas sp.]
MRLDTQGRCVLMMGWALVAHAEPIVIGHQQQQLEQLSSAELRAMFSMRRQFWQDGTAVVVFVLPADSPQHTQFCTKTLGLLPFQLTRAWDRLTFSGNGDRPRIVYTQAEMRRLVHATPGAIGYIEPASMSIGSKDDIKI